MHSLRNVTIVVVLALFAAVVPAQNNTQDQQPAETLKVEVNVVNVFFNVKDHHGALVPGLTKDDFEIYEDGKPQTIKYFAAESNQPLTLGLMIDTSGSMQRMLDDEKEVGTSFVRSVLRPDKDLAFLINFDVNVELDHDLTSSASDINSAMRQVKINTGGGGGFGVPGGGQGPFPNPKPRGTLLYDAVYLGSHDVMANEVGRKALIILTDGDDQGSTTPLKEAIEAAQKADTICYVLLIWDPEYGRGSREMHDLTEQTGGRMIEVGPNPKKLREAFDQIASELRSQYSLGYPPTNRAHDGSFRKIEIRAKNKDLKIQARKGYYAPTK